MYDSGCLQGLCVQVCNLKRDGSCLSVTRVRMAVIFQLHEAGWPLFFSYMRQDGGYLSVT
jgi:hypothetical protein